MITLCLICSVFSLVFNFKNYEKIKELEKQEDEDFERKWWSCD